MGKEKLIFVAILVLGLVLRLVGISQSFWLDEASQAQMSSQSVSQIWYGRSGDFQPPLFYLLAHGWLQGGHAESWLRLLPLALGLVSIGVLWALANALFPKLEFKIKDWTVSAGTIAAFLLATNPFHVYYSGEFRMYSLLLLLTLLSMLAYQKKHWSLFVFNAMMLYTHYISFIFILFQLIYSLFVEKKQLKYFLVSLGMSFLLYLPWVPQFIRQLNSGVNIDAYLPGWRSILGLSPLKAFPLTIFKLIAGRIDFVSQTFYALYMLFVLGLTIVAIFLAHRSRSLLVMWAAVPLVLAWIITFAIPVNQPFRLIIILPALLLIFTQAVIRFPRLFLTFLLYVSIAGLVMTYTRPRLQKEQWRQAAVFLEAKQDNDTSIIVKFSGNFAPLSWYAPTLPVIAAVSTFPAQAHQVATTLVQESLGSKVYVLDYLGELSDPYKSVDQTLSNLGYQQQDLYNFEGVGFIRLFEKQL